LHIPIDLVDDLLVAAQHVVAREARLLAWVRSDDFRLDEIAPPRSAVTAPIPEPNV